jgi:predicted component of viral defense system (DUF524 family)
MEIVDSILKIDLSHISTGLKIEFSDLKERFYVSNDYYQHNEAEAQFTEGAIYQYKIYEQLDDGSIKTTNWRINQDVAPKNIFKPYSNRNLSEGIFTPNIFVGTLRIPLKDGLREAFYDIEVQSKKIDYKSKSLKNDLGQLRSEYQLMLENIADYSIELILQNNVPILQSYEYGLRQIDEKELYQRFLFVRSLFKNQEIEETVQKIISNPSTRWINEEELRDVRSIRRFTPKNIRELSSRSNRIKLLHPSHGLNDIPLKISSYRKKESIDTPENRFIKHVLTSFLFFCQSIDEKLVSEKFQQERNEVKAIKERLENILNHSFFKEVNRPTTLKISSPVLQRRSGYRELLKAWLRFNLAAQLNWKFDDDDNIFSGGKKDIATLYEYWIFFVLFKTFILKFGKQEQGQAVNWVNDLIVSDSKGLGLTLKQGLKKAFQFNYNSGKRDLTIKFYYNRPFKGGRIYGESKKSGSYTKNFIPDYTLSVWPAHMKEVEAEETESIVHIHFDAKYKVDYFYKSKAYNDQSESSEEEEISTDELDELKSVEALEDSGTFKDIDLYKMHAYKDAIRRSGGAYILYPGSPDGNNVFQGYHEIIPGVGAFALRPSNENQAIQNLQVFISDIIDNLSDIISQRERLAKKKYEIIKDQPIKVVDAELIKIAHQIGLSESIDETYVLVGYCKSNNSHFNWISKNKKYNIRFGGNYQVNGKMATAKYLILYEKINGEVTFRDNLIFEIDCASTRLISKTDLINLQYPSTPNADSYLLFELINEIPLGQYKFSFDDRIKHLKEKLIKNSDRELPFAISIADLLKVRVK